MKRGFALIAFLLLALPQPASAQQSVPEVDEPEVPDVDEDAPVPTGIVPVDVTQEDALRAANATGRTLAPHVGTAWDAQGLVRENVGGKITFLFDDNAGHRWGGIGNWSVDGGSWEQRGTVHSTGGDAAGRYAGGLDTLLVLPEIDLTTGVADIPRGTPVTSTPAKANVVGTAWRAFWQHMNYVLNDECLTSPNAACIPWLGSQQDTQPPDGTHLLEFEHRRNVGNGRDGVQVLVFTQPPATALLEACPQAQDQRDGSRDKENPFNGNVADDVKNIRDTPCTIVPTLARIERPLTTFKDQPALTGFDTWSTNAVDLTPWAGRSVWVAFRFLSGGVAGAPYFRSTALFDQEAGFLGFQLGNVSVTGPAPAQSVRLRAPTQPAFVPAGLDSPAVGVGAKMPYRQHLLNLGTRTINVTLELEVEDVRTGASLLVRQYGPYRMGPGQVEDFNVTLAGVTAVERTVRIDARARTDAGLAAEVDHSDEADRSDDITSVVVEVRDIEVVDVGTLMRPVAQAAKDDVLQFRLPLTNRGTVATVVEAQAQVIHAQTNAPTTALSFEGGSTKTVVVPAGGTVEATWNVEAREPGQYNLFVRVNDARPFDAALDLLPVGLRAHQVASWDGVLPTIDGVLAANEWPTLATYPALFDSPYFVQTEVMGSWRIFSTGDRLFVAASLPNPGTGAPDNFYVALDNGGDRRVPFLQDATWSFASTVGNPAVVEASIPLTGPTALKAQPGRDLRILIALNDSAPATGGDAKRFPPVALADGEGLAGSDGSLRDEMDSWLALRLPTPGTSPLVTARRLSQGFGVDRAPPPLLQVDLDSCSDLTGWTQTAIHNMDATSKAEAQAGAARYSPWADKWNCGAYGADGATRLYEGRTPEAPCKDAVCSPASGLMTTGDSATADYNSLVSPAFQLGQAERPYLILRHQYSTETVINDHAEERFFLGQTSGVAANRLQIFHRARIYVEVLDETTGAWGSKILVRPDGGYSTEVSNGVQPAGKAPHNLQGPTNPASEQNLVPGWWWPTGTHPFAQDPDDPLPAGRTFEGSPWMVDRLPLFGFEHGAQGTSALFLENKTVRFKFEWLYPPLRKVDTTEPWDFGWRIEGLAVAEGERFSRDIAIHDLVVEPGADLARLGLGPGAPTHVNVTLTNQGTGPVAGGELCVSVTNVLAGAEPQDPCAAGTGTQVVHLPLLGILQPGEHRNVTAVVTAPAAGALAKFGAAVRLTAGDDFPADNVVRGLAPFEMQAAPDLGILVSAGRTSGAVGTSFPFQVVLQNNGNLPLSGFQLTRRFVFEDGDRAGQDVVDPLTWTVDGTLEVGARRQLQQLDVEPTLGFADLSFPGQANAGRFRVVLRAPLAADVNGADNAAVLRLQAVDRILERGFSGTEPDAGLAFEGTPDVWAVQSGALRAGTQAEMPPHTDATVVLTGDGPVDLRGARSATLSLRHRYDLESTGGGGFDAARVEVSTNGQDWRPLVPSPNPLQGLPDGYPSVPIVGDGALAGDAGTAFTGSSAELLGSIDGGWIESSFDLAQDPGLSRPALVEAFRLEDLSSVPETEPVGMPDGQLAFRANDWVLDEPGANVRHRSWSVQNLTYTEPSPVQGDKMWWSGTAGASVAGQDPQEAVRNQLNYTFLVPLENDTRVADDLLLTWWEWRAGHAEGGTGAHYNAFLNGSLVDPLTLAVRQDGWTQRAVDLAGFWNQTVEMRWDYDSERRATFLEPAEANNRGWFIDDVRLTTFGHDAQSDRRHSPVTIAGFGDAAEGGLAPGFKTKASTRTGIAPIAWTRVATGASQGPGGWHLERVQVPAIGEVPAWRFSSDGAQGYPHLADSRLVTPLVDLGDATGDLRLAFEHQYGFEALLQCEGSSGPECFRSAVDGGAVEVQTFDPASGTFGPWRQLGARFDAFPRAMVLDDTTADVAPSCDGPGDHRLEDGCEDHNRTSAKRRLDYEEALDWLGAMQATGYTAVEDRSSRLLVAHGVGGGTMTSYARFPRGHGTTFETFPAFQAAKFHSHNHDTPQNSGQSSQFTTPWLATNVSYLFSGASEGKEGWRAESWDISPLAGQQVRFGFHAASNPNLAYTDLMGEHRGWSVANLRVESQRFVGQPVDLRVRIATDESLGFGTWEIESATLTGALSERNVAVLGTGLPSVVRQGHEVVLSGVVSPLGSRTLNDLVLAVTVLDETHQTRLAADDVAVDLPTAEPMSPSMVLPGAHAAFALPPVSFASGSLPLEVRIDMPSQPATVGVRWQVLQLVGGAYVPPALDDPSNAVATWRLQGQDLALAAFQDLAGSSRELALAPAGPGVGDVTSATTRLVNLGTIPLEDVAVEWSIHEVLHRAVADQPFVGPEDLDSLGGEVVALGDLAPGAGADLQYAFTPLQPGLYRVGARATSSTPGFAAVDAILEVLVDLPASLHAADFSDGGIDGWHDVSDATNPDRGGGSPDELRFRLADDALLWGIDTAAFQQGTTYCSFGSCNFGVAQAGGSSTTPPPPRPPVVGLEGIAHGPPIDLTRLPMGQAYVTLRQSHLLEAGDGARLEFIPYRHPFDPAAPRPVDTCGGGPAGQDAGKPMPFVLDPESATAYDAMLRSAPARPFQGTPPVNGAPGRPGETAPERHNPLVPSLDHTTFALGGVGGIEAVRYRLDVLATAACLDGEGDLPEILLANYVVVPVLHVGTLPGHTAIAQPEIRRGAQGLQVLSIQVSSTDLVVAPDAATWAVQPGARKSFFVDVTNPSPVQGQVGFSLAQDHQLPDAGWVQLPDDVVVGPGQTVRVPIGVEVPAGEDARPGLYAAPLQVASRSDPTLVRPVLVRLDVGDVPLPDLTVRIGLDPGATLSSGTVEPIPIVAQNIGAAPSRPTVVEVTARDTDGVTTVLGQAQVGELCPPPDPGQPTACSGPDRATLTVQWTLPEAAGTYMVVARADPAAALPDGNRLNNLDARVVEVLGEQRPDLAVTSLIVQGVDEHGHADEGDALSIAAVLENLGEAPATQVRFSIRLGSSELNSTSLVSLAPGASVAMSAEVTPPAGVFEVWATARGALFEADSACTISMCPQTANDDRSRVVRIHGHDFELKGPRKPLAVLPGETVQASLNLTNAAKEADRATIELAPVAGWTMLAFPSPVTLGANQTIPVSVRLTAPANAPAGPTTVRVLVRSSGNTPRILDLAVEVLPLRTAPVATLPAGTALRPGPDAVPLPVNVTSRANFDQDVKLSLAAPNWAAAPVAVRLPAGATVRTQLLVHVPAATPVGDHNVTFAMQAANGTALGQSRAVVKVLPAPAVNASWLQPKREAGDLGERSVAFPLRLTNSGNQPLQAFAILEDLATGTVQESASTSALAPGQDQVIELTLRRGAGEHDDWNGLVEVAFAVAAGEQHLARRLPLPPLDAAPDLQVTRMDVSASGQARAGDAVRLVFLVKNQGAAESAPSLLHVFMDGSLVDSLDIPRLAAGAEARLSTTWTFARGGTFVLAAYADGLGSVPEAVEDDNGFSTSLHVQQASVGTRLRDVPDPGMAALGLAALAAAWARRRVA